MLKVKFLLIPLFLGLVACSDKEEENYRYPKSKEVDKDLLMAVPALFSTNHTRSPKQAEQIALDFIKASNEGDGLKSGKVLSVSDIIVIGSKGNGLKVATGLTDTLAYMVNLSNNSGYVYVCADDRVGNSVLAFSDDGNFAVNDNENFNYILARTEKYIGQKIRDFELNKESLQEYVDSVGAANGKTLKSIFNPLSIIKNLSIENRRSCNPLIKTKWGQNAPYNSKIYCNNRNCRYYGKKKAPTGCANTALAQICNFYTWPRKLTNATINYDKIKSSNTSTANSEIANLMSVLASNNKTKNWCSGCCPIGSATEHEEMMKTVRRFGYEAYETDYAANLSVSWLDLGRPILIRGRVSGQNYGHIWIMDGYSSYEIVLQMEGKVARLPISYFHHNWGWDGENNGYFAADVFDTKNANSYDGSSNGYNYKFDTDMKIINIYPGYEAWYGILYGY
ncbi:MAG: C10 family peptidase [Paludibacteraceae bacterium]|nr:C10 family peptidase [Paludibacteraceae bacterium]